MFGLGMTEILLVLGIALLVFGGSKLPGIGEAMGKAIFNFKKSVLGHEDIDVTPPKKQIDEQQQNTSTESSEKPK